MHSFANSVPNPIAQRSRSNCYMFYSKFLAQIKRIQQRYLTSEFKKWQCHIPFEQRKLILTTGAIGRYKKGKNKIMLNKRSSYSPLSDIQINRSKTNNTRVDARYHSFLQDEDICAHIARVHSSNISERLFSFIRHFIDKNY